MNGGIHGTFSPSADAPGFAARLREGLAHAGAMPDRLVYTPEAMRYHVRSTARQGSEEGKAGMKVSVILAHPNRGSFNHAIAESAVSALRRNGHEVRFHDLCAEGFDPLLPYDELSKGAPLPPSIARHCAEIADADGIVIVHPNWWGQPPAILKGWIDRVIRPGVAYEFLEGDSGEGVPRGLLCARTAVVFNTGNTEAERERRVFGDPLDTLWKNCIFGLCGVDDFHRRLFTVVITSTEEQRLEWLTEVQRTMEERFPGTADGRTGTDRAVGR